ncbi:uncharacterized protein DS421_20g694280 [Arachis hypogaea]|uniref:Ubiquitin-like protease family profile domain-containing protein n=1 Tax=Arachis hypogaea TaxID=3818 RepID=A0A444X3C1_ARAHY|nr:uncharacterized protein DS421_20g694280 [Arachis hypogaea]RYQ84149.1 hypothetical protein Ahy_B10g103083 [Arachis hypogaea]
MIASLKAMRNKAPRIWYFSYDFATAVLTDAPIPQLQNRQVFVPIWEAGDAWYVMLLDVKASKIYTLDVNRSPESIVRRESNMTKICHALGKIFVHSRNLVNFRHTNPDPSNWGHFIYPQGLPKDLDSAESAIWCLSLLQHNGGFSTKLFRHMGNSEHMRMRAALNIVQSDVNQCRGFIDSKAEVVWRLITSCNDKDSMSGGGL